MRTNLLAGATAFSLLLGFVTPVMALTSHEVEAVVGVVEQLAQEMGEGMVADAAGIFYDYDSLGAALIPEAGFSRESWIIAYDAVTAGYMATIPQEEFDAVFEEPLATLEASELPEEQKAMLREHVAGLIAEAQAVRQSGMQYADVVRPYEARLYPLFYGAFGE